MTQSRRSWIFAIVFWLLFLVSIGLNERYPWVPAVWVYAALSFAIVTSIFSVNEMFRRSNGSGIREGQRETEKLRGTLERC